MTGMNIVLLAIAGLCLLGYMLRRRARLAKEDEL